MADDAPKGSIAQITRPAKTAGYAPHVWTGNRLGEVIDGRPRFTWLEVGRMRLDPQIQFGLRILRAPLMGVTWKTQADSPALQSWIDREFGRIYRRMLPRLVRFFEYGVAAGELTFCAKRSRATGKTRVHFSDFLEFHPRDVRPLIFERGSRAGDMAGLHVTGVRGGSLYLDKRHGFFFRGESEYGETWGRPRLAGPYEPWVEKRGRHGAVESRRLFYKKCAFRGPRMRYPIGKTDLGNPDIGSYLVSNQDIARELVEKFENGGVLALPNVKGVDGTDLWSWEDAQSFADVAGLIEYPKQLDKEILIGFGIPPELVDAATVGSGYSGRAIPAQVFFTSMDEVAQLIFEAIDTQIMKFLVRLNFGRRVSYEIIPNSLAQMVAQADPRTSAGGGGGDKPSGAPDAGSSLVPYTGPHGGHGMRDPRTGRVSYGKSAEPNSYTRLSLTAAQQEEFFPDTEPDPRTLWEQSDAPVLAEKPPLTVWRDPKAVRLSQPWNEGQHPRGQPENKGEFASKQGTGTHVGFVAADLPAPSEDPKAKAPNPALPAHTRPALSPTEAAALAYYASYGYVGINKHLRGQPSEDPDHDAAQHQQIQAAFAKAPQLDRPVAVYRAFQLANLDDADREAFLKNLADAQATGGTVTLPGYTSTTTDKKWVDRLGDTDVLEIAANRGLDVKPYSRKPHEQELLLDHNSRFRVLGVRTEDVKKMNGTTSTKHVITLEQVGHE